MNKHTVLLGPDWFDCAREVSCRWLFVPTLLLIASISVSNFWMEELRFFSLPFRFFFHLVHFALLYCYVSVGMVDPGIVVASEENSVENKERLESQDYFYCTLCQAYCPPHTRHCSQCGVCIRYDDHHCGFMG